MERLKIIKNAVNSAKRLNKEWLDDNGYNPDIKPHISIYKNAYMVGMSINKELYNVKIKKYNDTTGKKIYSNTFNNNINHVLTNDLITIIETEL
jgi:hypothetical protein